MKYFLYVFIALFSIQSYAAASRDEYLLQRQIQAVEHQNKVYGIRAVVARESVPIAGTTQTQVRELIKRSIAVDNPTASKVGSSMFKRIYSPQQLLGTAAVTGLLTAIGWVMEEGSYVKKVPKNQPFACSVDNLTYGDCNTILSDAYKTTAKLSASQISEYSAFVLKNPTSSQYYGSMPVSCSPVRVGSCTNDRVVYANFRIRAASLETTNVPLTPALLGAVMLGAAYSDPAGDKSAEATVNDGDYTGVKETYEHDPSGIGNEVADDMDKKLDDAPQTPENKPSSIPDPAYDTGTLAPDADTADRSWTEKGDEATGSTEPTKDPVTGENTGGQSISLQFPLFCSWASKMCLWYDDWKESDKIHQKFEEDVKNHQSDEKSFWQTVKDWFDWTKQEPEPEENQQPEPDDQGIFTRTFDTTFSLSKQCPPDIPINFESTYLTGSYNFSMNWLCIIFSFMGYPLIFLSHCIGIWILYETVTQKEIKW